MARAVCSGLVELQVEEFRFGVSEHGNNGDACNLRKRRKHEKQCGFSERNLKDELDGEERKKNNRQMLDGIDVLGGGGIYERIGQSDQCGAQ